MTIEDLFFELVQVSLGQRTCLSHTPSEDEWQQLYDIAEKQSLIGICFAGVQKLCDFENESYCGMNESQYLTWMGVTAVIQQKNQILDEQCATLQKRLSIDGLRSCILKGQGVALLYSESLRGLRQPGDIDIWIDAPKEKVIEYVMRLAPTKQFDQKHIHFNCFEDTDVEAHWIPVKRHNPLWNRILKNYFNQERKRQFHYRENGLCVPTFDFQVVHQLLHVYSHYVYEGVGLRQMMDLYFAQLACRNCAENSVEYKKYHEIVRLFRRLGLQKFVAATQWVLQEVFGMSENIMLCAPNEKEGRKLLDEIMIGGNFGHHDERNYVKNESFVHRFFRRWGRKFRMFRFDPLETLIMPFSRLKLEFWMRSVRRKYNV